MKRVLISLVIILGIFLAIQPPVYAALGIRQPGTNGGIQVGSADADTLMGTIIRNAILLVFTIASVSAIFMFLWGAVDWILSGGDKEKVASARKKITQALVGLVLLAVSFLIMSVIGVYIGINPFKNLQIPYLGQDAAVSSGNAGGITRDPNDPNYKCGSNAFWDSKDKKCKPF